PLVVSRTAVTDQAAELALLLRVTLIGYARGRRMTVYSSPERLDSLEPASDVLPKASDGTSHR
ncbi:MAG: formate dehydrogenase accessory sulfurtransferase FdhD, partial [Myxococcota bacterium]